MIKDILEILAIWAFCIAFTVTAVVVTIATMKIRGEI